MTHPPRPAPASLFPLVLLVLATGAPAVAAQVLENGRDGGGPAVTVGGVVTPSFNLYEGPVRLHSAGGSTGAQYRERARATAGFGVALHLDAGFLGPIGISGYGSAGRSEGDYGGLGPGDTKVRDLLTMGVDLAFRPALWGSGGGALRVPFGPSVSWQRLSLSQGHRDQYGDPLGFTSPEIDWTDRSWFALGGHAGLQLEVPVRGRVGLTFSTTGRIFRVGNSSWEGPEEEAIRRATGRTVKLNYSTPLVLTYDLQGAVRIHL